MSITSYKADATYYPEGGEHAYFNLERHEEAVLKATKSGREVAEPARDNA
jgi:hypothetical protein